MRLYQNEMEKFVSKIRKLEKNGGVIDLDKATEKSEELISQLKDPIVVAAIQRLWNPGIMTHIDLEEMTGESEDKVNEKMKVLRNLGIIKDICIGIHGKGEYGNFMMNVFAWIILEVIKDENISVESSYG
jgi:hypothetical protein